MADAFGTSHRPDDLALAGVANPQLREGVLRLASRPDCPRTSSTGRLFDAVASLLDLRHVTSFEGQAAMELEQAATAASPTLERYPYRLVEGETIAIRFAPAIRRLVDDVARGRTVEIIARIFHNTLAGALVETTAGLADRSDARVVALTGGALQNHLLHRLLSSQLRQAGFKVLFHRQVPPNDGGLSLGQAWAGVLSFERQSSS